MRRNGSEIHVRPKTFQILLYLLAARDRLVTKEELMEGFWKGLAVTDDALTQSIAELRRAFGDTPRQPLYFKTVPRRGYRFVGEVQEFWPAGLVVREETTTLQVEEEYTDDTPAERSPQALLPAAGRPSRTALFRIAGLVLILAAVAVGWLLRDRRVSLRLPQIAGKSSIVVLYFDNESQSRELDWLREGLADLLITNLSRSSKLTVLSRQQLHVWLARNGGQNKSTGLDQALKLGAQAGAEVLVLGSFASFGKSLRVNIHLHDARDGRLLGSETATAETSEQILDRMDLISIKLASRFGAAHMPQGEEGLPLTHNLEAYRSYSLALEKAEAYHTPEALALLERAIELDPKFAMAHARIGYTYSVIGNLNEKGKPYLEKAFQLPGLTERDRLNVAAWYAIANADYAAAVRAYRRIVAQYPQEIEAYERLGRLLIGEEQPDEAITVFKAGLTIDPDAPGLYNQLGGIYSQLGRHDEAIATLQHYLALAPAEANAHDSLGLAFDWAGRYEHAERSFRRALELAPGFEIAVAHLAELRSREGRYREALRYLEQYIRLARSAWEHQRGLDNQAVVYFRQNELGRAEAAARAALMQGPADYSSTRDLLMLILARQGRVTEALALPPSTPPNMPNRGMRSPQRWYSYAAGERALLANHPDEAIAHFQKAVRQLYYWAAADRLEDCLANAYLRLGRLDEAIGEYERVLRARPHDARSHYGLGMAYRNQGSVPKARAEFLRFLDLWKTADADGPEVVAARSFVEKSGAD